MKALILSVITAGLSFGTLMAQASEVQVAVNSPEEGQIAVTQTAAAQGPDAQSGFDSNEEARFDRINVPVGTVQLKTTPTIVKKSASKKKAVDNILAIGLSPSEMKNLNVECGQLLEVESGDREVKASVFRLTGEATPAHATINLSPAAAAKLQVKSGDMVVIHHLEDTTLPNVVNKSTSVIDFSTRGSEEGNL